MSVTFSIPNKKKLFGYQPCLSINDCLACSKQDLSQFSVDETLEDFDPALFYSQPLSHLELIVLGIYKESGRGFELSFDKESQSYNIRILTPSTKNDWVQALNMVQGLSEKLQSSKLTVEGEPFASQDIWNFDYQYDITFGLRHIHETLTIGDSDYMLMPGLIRPWYINAELIGNLLDSPDPVADFSQKMLDHQNLDAYDANQQFFETQDGDIVGNYTLTQGVETILPLQPTVEFYNTDFVNEETVKEWHLSLVGHEGDGSSPEMYFRIGPIPYKDFIDNLPEDCYDKVDARNILTKALTQGTLQAIFQASKPIL